MLKKLSTQPQLEMFKTVLGSKNPKQELCLLSKEIDWDYLEKEFAPLYGEVGRLKRESDVKSNSFNKNQKHLKNLILKNYVLHCVLISLIFLLE